MDFTVFFVKIRKTPQPIITIIENIDIYFDASLWRGDRTLQRCWQLVSAGSTLYTIACGRSKPYSSQFSQG